MTCASSCKISLTLTHITSLDLHITSRNYSTSRDCFTSRDYVQSRATFQEPHFISCDPLVLRKIFALPTRLLLSQTYKITYSSSPLSQLMSLFGLVLISELEHFAIKFADVHKDAPTFTKARRHLPIQEACLHQSRKPQILSANVVHGAATHMLPPEHMLITSRRTIL